MECNIISHGGKRFAFGINQRITVGQRTIQNAIGKLVDHIEFIRGTTQNSAEELAKYKLCRDKWEVPEVVTDTTFGWGDTALEGTSGLNKRRRT